MNDKKPWQDDLDKFLAESSPSLDNQVLARTYSSLNDKASKDNCDDHDTISQIENALHIEQHLEDIGLQAVPESLQHALKNISNHSLREQTQTQTTQKNKSNVITANFTRFAATISTLAACITIVAVMGMHWLSTPVNQQQPTVAEIHQAQQELAVAFRYLSIAKNKSTTQVKQTINLKLHQPMMKSLLHPLTLFKES